DDVRCAVGAEVGPQDATVATAGVRDHRLELLQAIDDLGGLAGDDVEGQTGYVHWRSLHRHATRSPVLTGRNRPASRVAIRFEPGRDSETDDDDLVCSRLRAPDLAGAAEELADVTG